MNDYSVVVGIDKNHVTMANRVIASWVKNKPSVLRQPLVVFFDCDGLDEDSVKHVFKDFGDVSVFEYGSCIRQEAYLSGGGRWYDRQRQKMLAGFVHLAPWKVATKYWLKLDLDVVAMPGDDWIQDSWFCQNTAVVGHRWGYTKPAGQLDALNEWAKRIHFPSPPVEFSRGSEADYHPRIASYCAFFGTEFTREASEVALSSCAPHLMPCPSQDGYHWYFAVRRGLGVSRVDMKAAGWVPSGTKRSLERLLVEAGCA